MAFYRTPPLAASVFFKSNQTAILQRCLKKCPCYDVLIIFPFQHVLNTCLIYGVFGYILTFISL